MNLKGLRADRRIGLLLGGVMLLAFVAIGATVALPASDPALDVEAAELSEQARAGMELYRTEGLWQCHAPYTRHTAVDGAGATTAEDIGNLSPAMLGLERTSDATTAESIAAACGVGGLSSEDLAAIDAFLAVYVG